MCIDVTFQATILRTIIWSQGQIPWIHTKRYGMSRVVLILYSVTHHSSRELAELLGQVKPPTATKEDIDKSGLQIIKASELSHYEQEGRVSANCLDRVRHSQYATCENFLTCLSVPCMLGRLRPG